jgi:dTDP-4-dehydrorhamnose 3,5-epimerase-like enzyme
MAENQGPFPGIRPRPIPVIRDARGALWKALNASQWGGNRPFGEIYLVATRKGALRGNHYHEKTREWFIPVQGEITCLLEEPGTALRAEFVLSASKPEVLEVPPGIAHALANQGQDTALVLAYADQEYDEQCPDIIPFEVLKK